MTQTARQEAPAHDAVVIHLSRGRRWRKRVLLVALVGALLLAAAGYGYHWWTVGRWLEVTDDAYVGGNVTSLSSQVAGHVAAILVHDNQAVKAGQIVLRIDDAPFKAAVDKARAEVRKDEAGLAILNARYAVQRSMIAGDVADLDARTAAARFAHQDARRYLRLAATVAGTQQGAQRAQSQSEQAQAAVRVATAGLAAARQQLTVIEGEISNATASVAAAKADLKTAELDLGYTEIRAPIDGYVGHRSAQVGAYVSAGSYLLTIVPSRALWVDANFKEDQLAGMRNGDPVRLSVDAIPGQVFRGHVASFAPATGSIFSIIPAENATGNFTKIVQRVPVRVAFDAVAGLSLLRPGLSATVTIDTRPNRGER